MISEFWYAVAFSALIYVGLWSVGRWVLPRFRITDGSIESREIILERQIIDLEKRLKESERKNIELEHTQEFLLLELKKSNARIVQQEEKILVLNGKVRELEKPLAAIVSNYSYVGRVLGIWPTSLPLDVEGEKNAIFQAGLPYEAVEGEYATRMGIVEQLSQRDDYTIIEIGAKGSRDGIMLSDGLAPAYWWQQLAKQHSIQIFVVLANESSKPGTENIADALFNSGAKAVISVDSSINDVDAVKFARMFYRRLSRGTPLAEAVGYARLVITDAGADAIKLRER